MNKSTVTDEVASGVPDGLMQFKKAAVLIQQEQQQQQRQADQQRRWFLSALSLELVALPNPMPWQW